MTAKPPRILVIGSTDHPRSVETRQWNQLGETNVSDYDVIFFNLVDQETLRNLPDRAQLARFFFGSHELTTAWVVGNPTRAFGSGRSIGESLPTTLKVREEKGTQIESSDSTLATYLDLLPSYSWFAERNPVKTIDPQQYLRLADVGPEFKLHPTTRATTKAGGGIVVAVGLALPSDSSLRGLVVFAHEPTNATAAEGINELLRTHYEIAEQTREPNWAAKHELPAEVPHRQAIETARAEIGSLEHRIAESERKWQAQRRFRGLLYEQGEDVLEPLVREALAELGAAVMPPERRGEHDGRAVDPAGRRYVLEIKGRTRSLRKQDATQAAGHVAAVDVEEGKGAVGLIVANAFCDQPLSERPAAPFEPNGMTAVRNAELRVMKTTQLFEALRQKQLGNFNATAFWSAVYAAIGTAELPEPTGSVPVALAAVEATESEPALPLPDTLSRIPEPESG